MECPLCGFEEVRDERLFPEAPGSTLWRSRIACARCGVYEIGNIDAADFRPYRGGTPPAEPSHFPMDRLHLVSGYIREMTLLGSRPVEVNRETAATMARGAPSSVTERIDRLLLNLARRSTFGGESLGSYPLLDYPLGYCRGMEEFTFFIDHLTQTGLITGETYGHTYELALTVAGWARVQELERPTTHTRQCFVAMSFAPDLAGVYERGIAPAVETAGYKPLVLSREEHADRVDERIVLELNRSRFVVADFTGQRPSVYFEAGYGLGRGIPVIWTCRADWKAELHFDTRQYNYIFWKDEADLRERLYTRIRTMIG